MRKFFLILVSWIYMSAAMSQSYYLDSLRYLLSKSKPDTNAINLLSDLALGYEFFHPDSTYYYARQGFLLARRLGNKFSEANALINMSIGLRKWVIILRRWNMALQSLKICEQMNSSDAIFRSRTIEINSIYYFLKDGKNCIAYALRTMDMDKGKTDFKDQKAYT